MSRFDMVSRTFEFLRVFGAAEKIQALASQQFFGSQSVKMFGFARKTKIPLLKTHCLN